MIRKSVLVYDLLKSEKRNDGFSPTEIWKRVSEMHDITPGKGLKKQVDVALRRGVDFGILVKKNKKYTYDSHPNDPLNQPAERKAKARRKATKKPKKRARRSKSRRKRAPSSSRKRVPSSNRKRAPSSNRKGAPSSSRKRAPPSSRKQSYHPPRPRVPPPPDWTPKRRNMREETIPKFIKHRPNSPRLL